MSIKREFTKDIYTLSIKKILTTTNYIYVEKKEINKRYELHNTTFTIYLDQKNHLEYKNLTEQSKEIHNFNEIKPIISGPLKNN